MAETRGAGADFAPSSGERERRPKGAGEFLRRIRNLRDQEARQTMSDEENISADAELARLSALEQEVVEKLGEYGFTRRLKSLGETLVGQGRVGQYDQKRLPWNSPHEVEAEILRSTEVFARKVQEQADAEDIKIEGDGYVFTDRGMKAFADDMANRLAERVEIVLRMANDPAVDPASPASAINYVDDLGRVKAESWEWGNNVEMGRLLAKAKSGLGGEPAKAQQKAEEEKGPRAEALVRLRGINAYERAGSISVKEFDELRLAIQNLDSVKDQGLIDFYSARLEIVADVTGDVNALDPRSRKSDGVSNGLGMNLNGNELGLVLEKTPGSLEALQKLMLLAGFELGVRGDKPNTHLYFLDFDQNGDLARLFGPRWNEVKTLNYWEMKQKDVNDFRTLMRFWVCGAIGKPVNEENLSSYEVVDAASLAESLFKHSRLTEKFEIDDSHPLLGRNESFGILQPWRIAARKTDKFGVFREFIKRKYKGEGNKPWYEVADESLGGLFIKDFASSYWLGGHALSDEAKNAGFRNIKEMILSGHLPSAADFGVPLKVIEAGHKWGSAAKINAFYESEKPLVGVGKPGWAEKFVLKEGEGETSLQTLLKNLKVFDLDRGEFITKKDAILKSILLARVGVTYDERAPDRMRINMDKDDMFALITQLNARKFAHKDGELSIVTAQLAEWLLDHSKPMTKPETIERYKRMRTPPSSDLYRRWMEANEKGQRDEMKKLAALARFKESFEDYLDPRRERTVPFESRLSMIPDESGAIKNVEAPKQLKFPLPLGWLTSESEYGFVKSFIDEFQNLAGVDYFGELNDQASVDRAVKSFTEKYLLAKFGFNAEGRLRPSEVHLAEFVFALSNVPLWINIRNQSGDSFVYNNPVLDIPTKDRIMSLAVLSDDGSFLDMRKRREDKYTGRTYREMVVAKAKGLGSQYVSLRDTMVAQENTLSKTVWGPKGHDDMYTIGV